MSSPARISLELPADPNLLVVACSCVRLFAQVHGLSDRECQRLELATDEVCSNVICHAYERDAERRYRIEADVEDNAIVVRVFDSGNTFALSDVKIPDTACCLQERPIGGLGIHLVRKVTDSVDYRTTAEGEHCFEFIKRLPPLAQAAEA